VIDLQAQQLLAVPHALIQMDLQLSIRLQGFDALDVLDTRLGLEVCPVAGRKGGTIAPQQTVAARLSVAADQRLVEFVMPGTHRPDHLLLQRCQVRHLHVRRTAADRHVHLRHRRIADMHMRFNFTAMQDLAQQLLDPLHYLWLIAFAWNQDDGAVEASERITPQQQARALTTFQLQHAHRHLEQLVFVGLEQFLARQDLQNMQQSLAGMTRRQQP